MFAKEYIYAQLVHVLNLITNIILKHTGVAPPKIQMSDLNEVTATPKVCLNHEYCSLKCHEVKSNDIDIHVSYHYVYL